jgi:hypothetical protein
VIPLGFGAYGDADGWCWIVSGHNGISKFEGAMLRAFTFYMIIWLSAIFIITLY